MHNISQISDSQQLNAPLKPKPGLSGHPPSKILSGDIGGANDTPPSNQCLATRTVMTGQRSDSTHAAAKQAVPMATPIAGTRNQ